jgi:hypothetical protein
MNNLRPIIAIVALLSSAQVLANNANMSPTSGKTHTMKDCMAKQKSMNAGMTQAAMETVCKNETKGNGAKDGNDLATGTKQNTDPTDK